MSEMTTTILITGASGNVSARVAALLAAGSTAPRLRLMTRAPHRAPVLPNSEVFEGDYADPASLQAAFVGIGVAFVVSGYAAPGERALLHKNVIDAAVLAGVQHLVYLSFQGAAPDSKFPMARDHYETERYLQASGMPYTALRDNLYMDLVPEMFNSEGVVRGPAGNGSAAFVAREDVARVVAAILLNPGKHSGAYDVTGPDALTLSEVASRLSALAGRELRYIDEPVEDGRVWRRALGAPEWEVDTWLGSYEAIAAGELRDVSDTVERFTGRPAIDMESYFRAHPELLAPLLGRGDA